MTTSGFLDRFDHRIDNDYDTWHARLTVLNVGGSVVPEPGTWSMMNVGFGLVGAGMRRHRRAAAA